MPLLDRSGAKEDVFVKAETAEINGDGHVLVQLGVLDEVLSRRGSNQQIGVAVSNDIKVEALLPVLDAVGLIAIDFPSFGDGRGFSLARQLRIEGYTGTLRASGPLIADQFAYALACGFDEVELPAEHAERQPVEHWLRAAGSMSHAYQGVYDSKVNILEQRRAARRREAGDAG